MRFLIICFGSLIALALPTWAIAASKVEPFRPALTHSDRPEICAPFLKEWTSVFDSSQKLRETAFNLSLAYPASLHASFPPDGRGMYGQSFSIQIDFDQDGSLEVLHIDSYDIGWRYLGADLFLFEDEADLAIAGGSLSLQNRLDLKWRDGKKSGASFKPLFQYRGPIAAARIILLGGEIYTLTHPLPPTEAQAMEVSLIQLSGGEQPRAVCTVQLLPARSTQQPFLQTSTLAAGLADVYGGPQGCLGTMGWTARPMDAHLLELFHRPWAVLDTTGVSAEELIKSWKLEDSLRELRYLAWGVIDPQSWLSYLSVKQGRKEFISFMREHYRENFSRYDSVAGMMAEAAWRIWMDGIFYARNNDYYSLVKVGLNRDSALPIGPDSTPEEVAKVAVEAWLAGTVSTTRSENLNGWIATQSLLAAVYARLPRETINAIIAAREDALSRIPARTDPASSDLGADNKAPKRSSMENPLLAAIGDTELMEVFLDLGADARAKTSWFNKTPLMYAAQQNQIESVQLLLDREVDVNAFTDGTNNRCTKLDRDNRTALMYAAENSSAALIELLLDAGADPGAIDTQGNTAAWYFSRNALIDDDATRRRIEDRLGRAAAPIPAEIHR